MDLGTQQIQPTAEFSLARTFPHTPRWSYQGSTGIDDTDGLGDIKIGPTLIVEDAEAQVLSGKIVTQFFGSEQSTEVDFSGMDNDNTWKTLAVNTKPTIFRGQDALTSWRDDYPIDSDIATQQPNFWAAIRSKYHQPMAEWLGTTILLFIGCSCNLSVITSKHETGDTQSVYWCWGFAVMISIYISGGASGAFLNPSLTIMLCIFRGFPARRMPAYVLAQVLGAFTGALLAFAIYRDDILHLDGALIPESTGVAFYTQPQVWVSPITAFATEMLGTALISISVLALGDAENSPPGAGMHALVIGLLITATDMSLSYPTGGCFNPARDLGPRIALLIVGYPPSFFTAHQNWWIWGPWCATIVGALFGGLVYDLIIFKGSESPVNYHCGQGKGFEFLRLWDKTKKMNKEKDLEAARDETWGREM